MMSGSTNSVYDDFTSHDKHVVSEHVYQIITMQDHALPVSRVFGDCSGLPQITNMLL